MVQKEIKDTGLRNFSRMTDKKEDDSIESITITMLRLKEC